MIEKSEMFYNKMEAIQERIGAEKMILGKDYVGARGKLLKAQKLFPKLDHIGSMVTVCDILSAANNIVPGYDVDHYWVLHLMPSSTSSDVKLRYQKLFSLLQPIKDRFPGTELALKLIEDAFSVLSDQDKRLEFDLKRGTSWASYGSFDVEASIFSSMSGEKTEIIDQISSGCELVSSDQSTYTLSKSSKDLGSELRANYNTIEQDDDIGYQEPDSFSSELNYQRKIRSEIDTLEQDYHDFESYRKANSFEKEQIWAAHYNSYELQNVRYARINTNFGSEVSVTWLKPVPITQDERRWCEAGLPVACGSFCLDLEMREKVSGPMLFSHCCSWVPRITEEQIEIYPKKGEVWAVYEDWDLDEWAYNPDNVKECKFKLVVILSDFSKYFGVNAACLIKVDRFQSIFRRQITNANPIVFHISPSNLYMFSHLVPSYQFSGGEIDGVVSGMFELDKSAVPNNVLSQMPTENRNSDSSNITSHVGRFPSFNPSSESRMPPEKRNSDSSKITSHVGRFPSSESNILGSNRLPSTFSIGCVWAVYCGKDLMPRQYARINNVTSGNHVSVTFLEHEPILDYEINWKNDNLPIVCGTYRAGKTNVNLHTSKFSHLVQLQTSNTSSIYKIYPMKGEIWAMYKGWNGKWNHSDYKNSQYFIVEILSNLSDDGMRVVKLEEVKGCLTFFDRQQQDGFDLIRRISKSEMLSFSHQIPAFRVPGIGVFGIPESSWHLEPDALPPKYVDKRRNLT